MFLKWMLFLMFFYLPQLRSCLIIYPVSMVRWISPHGFRLTAQSLFWGNTVKCVWKEISKRGRVTLYRARIPGRKSEFFHWTLTETLVRAAGPHEGNHKILRGSGYLTWLNADTSQATHKLTSEIFFFSLYLFLALSFPYYLCQSLW